MKTCMRTARLLLVLLSCVGSAFATRAGERLTELGIQGGGFTLDGKPTFLLGCSYYAGIGASEENPTRIFVRGRRV